jgi:isopropylmalate/homocitrate/citramalate synthase
MKLIRILDCTLGDGIVEAKLQLSDEEVNSVITELSIAGIDLIAVGNGGVTYAPQNKARDKILAVTKDNAVDTLTEAADALNQGYKLYLLLSELQSYEDIEILGLIKQINGVNPTAVILADEIGTGLLHAFYLFDHNLNAEIDLGYRAYNGMGTAVGDMLQFVELGLQRDLLLVTSLMGIGFGAGYAPTEIIAESLNSIHGKSYDVLKIAECAKKNIEPYLIHLPWGYIIDGFLMAVNARNGIYPADTEGLG